MTIVESTQLLLQWFAKKDSFSLKSDFLNLFPQGVHISETANEDKAAVLAGLEELVLAGFIRKVSNPIFDFEYYILVKPLESLFQTVSISATTASIIYEIVEKFNNKDILFNPLQITERDILMAITVLTELNRTNKLKHE